MNFRRNPEIDQGFFLKTYFTLKRLSCRYFTHYRENMLDSISFKNLPQGPEAYLRQLGWNWALGEDTFYISNELIEISEQLGDQYAQATNDLYDMCCEALEHCIQHERWDDLEIPKNLREVIRYTWNTDHHLHMYSRFDLAGGIGKSPIKLLEFNADTPTCLPETAIVQWAQMKQNNLDESRQFNFVYEAIKENFIRLMDLNPDKNPAMLFTAIEGFAEDDTNLSVLMEAAKEVGFEVDFAYVQDIDFAANEGVFLTKPDGNTYAYPYLFKLIPWEEIGLEEPELADLLSKLIMQEKVMVLNPPYTLVFQSKALLKYLWDLYPYHPLLLETDLKPLKGKKQVEKVNFGREGANIRIIEADGQISKIEHGPYQDFKKIYQAYTPLAEDRFGQTYQAGVFFAYEACGLGFRKGGKIINDGAQFYGNIISAKKP